jgi:hypothetical protein
MRRKVEEPKFTINEIIEILQRASENPRQKEISCPKCNGTNMREGSDGPYCFDCFRERKIKLGEWNNR